MNDMEQHSRRACFEIHGVPVTEDEDTDEIVKNIDELIDVNIDDEDISISHRLNANISSKRDPLIIVKFIRRKDKSVILKIQILHLSLNINLSLNQLSLMQEGLGFMSIKIRLFI